MPGHNICKASTDEVVEISQASSGPSQTLDHPEALDRQQTCPEEGGSPANLGSLGSGGTNDNMQSGEKSRTVKFFKQWKESSWGKRTLNEQMSKINIAIAALYQGNADLCKPPPSPELLDIRVAMSHLR